MLQMLEGQWRAGEPRLAGRTREILAGRWGGHLVTALLIIWLAYGEQRPIVVGTFPVAICESMASQWQVNKWRKAKCLVIHEG